MLVKWDLIKGFVDQRMLSFQWVDLIDSYFLEAHDGNLHLECILHKDGGADQTTFEGAYKDKGNKPLGYNFSNITGNTTITVATGVGVLYALSINNNNTGGTVIIYDNTAASGTKIGTFSIGTPSGGLLSSSGENAAVVISNILARFTTGLTVVTAGSTSNDITVYYR